MTVYRAVSYALTMPRGIPTSEDIKRKALALLIENDGNVKRTARMLGITRQRIQVWRDKSSDPIVYGTIAPEIRRERTERWGAVQDLAANRMTQLLPVETDLDAVTKAAQVSSQQYLDHRDGRRGMGPGVGLTINGPVQFVLKQETFDTI